MEHKKRDRSHFNSILWHVAGLFTAMTFSSDANAAASLEGSARCNAYASGVFSGQPVATDLRCVTVIPSNAAPAAGERRFVPGETYNSGVISSPGWVNASYVYRSNFGDLGVYAGGGGVGDVHINPSGERHEGIVLFGYDSAVNLQFRDVVTLTSNTLAVGTPVVFNLSGQVEGSILNGQLIAGYQGTSFVAMTATISLIGPVGVSLSFCTANVATCNLPQQRPFGSYDVQVSARIGDVFQLDATLESTVSTQYRTDDTLLFSNYYKADSADAFNSLHVFLQSDSAVSFDTESGHHYTTPVPEPSAPVLFGIGFFALALSRFRHPPVGAAAGGRTAAGYVSEA